MTPVVTDRERWIALGLLVAVLLIAYGVLIHPWWTVPMREVSARIDLLQERNARLQAELAQAPAVQRRLQEAQQRLATRPGFLPEATAELAVAGLVQRLETVVAQASPGNRSCQIQNRSPLQNESGEAYTRVAVQVRLRCGTPELAAVLHALEAGTPRLFVENLNILAQRFFGGMEPNASSGGLDVSFDLVGYLRPAGAIVDGATVAPAMSAAPMQSAPPISAAPPAPVPTAVPGPGPAVMPGSDVNPAAPPPPSGITGPKMPPPGPLPTPAPSATPQGTSEPATPPSGGPGAP
ncbi:general secretion pathway protein GspM [Lysobacter sp. TY2-98]|nr:general secretion pathway protein GspM [Lysobacter sp. TY2-98]